MTDRTALQALLTAAEAGGWPDDYNATTLLPHPNDCRALAAYDGSLDSAHALHNAVLPGWTWSVRKSKSAAIGYCASLYDDRDLPDDAMPCGPIHIDSPDPARAWLIAQLRALIARASPNPASIRPE